MTKKIQYLKRLVAKLLIICYLLTQQAGSVYASPGMPQTNPLKPALDAGSIRFSEKIGTIQETFNGKTETTLILLQDAHSIPDAQRHLLKMIRALQKKHGIPLVALEGVSGKIDAQMFHSLPDQEHLKKTLQTFQEKGELAAGAQAALTDSQNLYAGLEDWPLYEKGLSIYLEASEKKEKIAVAINGLKTELDKKKKLIYSAELLGVDQSLEKFYAGENYFIQTLKDLAFIEAPQDTQLQMLLKVSQPNAKFEVEINHNAKFLESKLTHHPGLLKEFHQRFQAFRTSQISSEEFAKNLESYAEKSHVKIHFSHALSASIENHQKIQQIEGTKLFEAFHDYASKVRNSLLITPEQRLLNEASGRMHLLQKMNALEMSFEDWKTFQDQKWSSEENKILESLQSHRGFYEVSEKRDEIFYQNIRSLLRKSKVQSAILVTGGFHAHGLTQRLREEGISYVLAMPRINKMPEHSLYAEHMKGNVSWKKYFVVENGKIDLQKAFTRVVRDQLLGIKSHQSTKSPDTSKSFKTGDMVTGDMVTLKLWRDQLIRDLASQGKILDFPKYADFFDEVSSQKDEDPILRQWKSNIRKFVKAMRMLDQQEKRTNASAFETLRISGTVAVTTVPFSNIRPQAFRKESRSKDRNSQIASSFLDDLEKYAAKELSFSGGRDQTDARRARNKTRLLANAKDIILQRIHPIASKRVEAGFASQWARLVKRLSQAEGRLELSLLTLNKPFISSEDIQNDDYKKILDAFDAYTDAFSQLYLIYLNREFTPLTIQELSDRQNEKSEKGMPQNAQDHVSRGRQEARTFTQEENQEFRQLIDKINNLPHKMDGSMLKSGQRFIEQINRIRNESDLGGTNEDLTRTFLFNQKLKHVSANAQIKLDQFETKELAAAAGRYLAALDAKDQTEPLPEISWPASDIAWEDFVQRFNQILRYESQKNYLYEPGLTQSKVGTSREPFNAKLLLAAIQAGMEPSIRPGVELAQALLDHQPLSAEIFEGTENYPPFVLIKFHIPLNDRVIKTKWPSISAVFFKKPYMEKSDHGENLHQDPLALMETQPEALAPFVFSEQDPIEEKISSLRRLLQAAVSGRLLIRSGYSFFSEPGVNKLAQIMARTDAQSKAIRVDLMTTLERERMKNIDDRLQPLPRHFKDEILKKFEKWAEDVQLFAPFGAIQALHVRGVADRAVLLRSHKEKLFQIYQNDYYRPLVSILFETDERENWILSHQDAGDYVKRLEKFSGTLEGASVVIEEFVKTFSQAQDQIIFLSEIGQAILQALPAKPKKPFVRTDMQILRRRLIVLYEKMFEADLSASPSFLKLTPRPVQNIDEDKAAILQLALADKKYTVAAEMYSRLNRLKEPMTSKDSPQSLPSIRLTDPEQLKGDIAALAQTLQEVLHPKTGLKGMTLYELSVELRQLLEDLVHHNKIPSEALITKLNRLNPEERSALEKSLHGLLNNIFEEMLEAARLKTNQREYEDALSIVEQSRVFGDKTSQTKVTDEMNFIKLSRDETFKSVSPREKAAIILDQYQAELREKPNKSQKQVLINIAAGKSSELAGRLSSHLQNVQSKQGILPELDRKILNLLTELSQGSSRLEARSESEVSIDPPDQIANLISRLEEKLLKLHNFLTPELKKIGKTARQAIEAKKKDPWKLFKNAPWNDVPQAPKPKFNFEVIETIERLFKEIQAEYRQLKRVLPAEDGRVTKYENILNRVNSQINRLREAVNDRSEMRTPSEDLNAIQLEWKMREVLFDGNGKGIPMHLRNQFFDPQDQDIYLPLDQLAAQVLSALRQNDYNFAWLKLKVQELIAETNTNFSEDYKNFTIFSNPVAKTIHEEILAPYLNKGSRILAARSELRLKPLDSSAAEWITRQTFPGLKRGESIPDFVRAEHRRLGTERLIQGAEAKAEGLYRKISDEVYQQVVRQEARDSITTGLQLSEQIQNFPFEFLNGMADAYSKKDELFIQAGRSELRQNPFLSRGVKIRPVKMNRPHEIHSNQNGVPTALLGNFSQLNDLFIPLEINLEKLDAESQKFFGGVTALALKTEARLLQVHPELKTNPAKLKQEVASQLAKQGLEGIVFQHGKLPNAWALSESSIEVVRMRLMTQALQRSA